MDVDPMRAQSRSLVAGCVLAAIAVAGCAVLAVVKPQGAVGSAQIVMARESGAVYVRVGDRLHPVFNLASARLVARANATPVVVSERALEPFPRGPRLGIPGAPEAIGAPLDAGPWTVCDAERTVVATGVPLPALDPSRTVLVTLRGEGIARTHLLYAGRRAEVDLRDRAVTRALHLDGLVPLPISRALLDTVPEVPAVTAPRVPGAGSPGPGSLGGFGVGTVVRVARADGDEFFVVLADGVQRVGELAADVIRFAYGGVGEIPVVTPPTIASVPLVGSLPVADFPRSTRTPIATRDGMAVCASWQPGLDGPSNVVVGVGDRRVVDGFEATRLAQADGDGPRVDAVALPRGRSAYVRSARIVGDDGSTGPRFLVTDSGVVFGVRSDDDAAFLGLSAPHPAPWSVLAQLPSGPELGAEAASVPRDTVASPAQPAG